MCSCNYWFLAFSKSTVRSQLIHSCDRLPLQDGDWALQLLLLLLSSTSSHIGVDAGIIHIRSSCVMVAGIVGITSTVTTRRGRVVGHGRMDEPR
jgi:hypothetical protein